MHRAAARTPRSLAALGTAALAVAALAGCGGSSEELTAAQQLAQPGSAWAGLSDADRHTVLRACRLNAAIGVAGGASASDAAPGDAVARSAAFRQVVQLPTVDVRRALDQRFADGQDARQSIGAACRDAIAQQIALAHVGAAPHADFGPPARTSDQGTTLAVHGSRVTVGVRLSPPLSRLTVGDAPGRAPNPAHVAVAQGGDGATVRLTHVPRGVSYLRATVRSGAAVRHQLIRVTGLAPARLPAPRTFAPMTLKGTDSRGFALIYVPRDARATVTTDGSPLTLSSGRTVLLLHGLGPRRTTGAIPAGRYEDVRVRAHGDWTIRLVPAR